MTFAGKIAVVTGAAGGIGRAVVDALYARGATVVAVDLPDALAHCEFFENVVKFACNLRDETQITALVSHVEQNVGSIDIFISNAGILIGDADHAASAPNEKWQAAWELHVMSHVWAARAVLPSMIERGQGALVNVASAAGLLNQIGDAAYSATKAAAVSFAESLAIRHHDDGISVCVVCPQYVATPMLGFDDAAHDPRDTGLLTAPQVAQSILHGLEQGHFMILPHPEVAQYFATRATDHDRWLSGMRRLYRKARKQNALHPAEFYKLLG